jgi:hypothetical protein
VNENTADGSVLDATHMAATTYLQPAATSGVE